jgi:hypothetical protein
MRYRIAMLLAPLMAVTGFRFGKQYRWGVTLLHRAVYALVDTITANATANKMSKLR